MLDKTLTKKKIIKKKRRKKAFNNNNNNNNNSNNNNEVLQSAQIHKSAQSAITEKVLYKEIIKTYKLKTIIKKEKVGGL